MKINKSAFWLPGSETSDRREAGSTFSVFYSSRVSQAASAGHRTGVLICPGFGHEAMHAHRIVSAAAETIAEDRDCCALKFEWAATANSPIEYLNESFKAVWEAQLVDLCQWLVSSAQVQQVVVLAHRAASLIVSNSIEMLVERVPEISRVVYWQPVTSGATFIRDCELLSGPDQSLKKNDDSLIDLGGLLLSDKAITKFSGLEFTLSDDRTGVETAVLLPDDIRLSRKLIKNIEGSATTLHRYPNGADMLGPALLNKVPDTALSCVYEAILPIAENRKRERMAGLPGFSGFEPDAKLSLATPSYVEHIEQLTDTGAFVILSMPLRQNSKKVWLLPNGGAAYHIGPGRLHVAIARALAEHGIATARLDLRNLGEGLAQGKNKDSGLHPYPLSASDDIQSAVDMLCDKYGFEKIIVGGLCSAGHNSFHYYLASRDERVEEVVFINPIDFYWKEGMSVIPHLQESAQENGRVYTCFYDLGKTKKGILQLISKVICRLIVMLRERFSKGKDSALESDLLALYDRNIRVSLFVSINEPGMKKFRKGAGRARKIGKEKHLLSEYGLPESDHAFVTARQQQPLVSALIKHFSR